MALIATNSGQLPGVSQRDVYLIVMKGNFTLTNVPRPRRAKAPSGQYLSITFDAATFERLDLALRHQASSVSHLGPVSDLTL